MERKILFIAISVAVVGVVYNEEVQVASNHRFAGESDRVIAEDIDAVHKIFELALEAIKVAPSVQLDYANVFNQIKEMGPYDIYIFNDTPNTVEFYVHNLGLTKKIGGMLGLKGYKITLKGRTGHAFKYNTAPGYYSHAVKLYEKSEKKVNHDLVQRGSCYVFTRNTNGEGRLTELNGLSEKYGKGIAKKIKYLEKEDEAEGKEKKDVKEKDGSFVGTYITEHEIIPPGLKHVFAEDDVYDI